jgi:predicted ArsR family transcriptional regulator
VSLDRVTVQEAARILGISEHAVRQRLYRGTLDSEKDPEDGGVFVLLDRDPGESHEGDSPRDTAEMVEMLLDQVRYLREQLNRADERDRENRRIVAALTQRIPELEAPAEPREAPQTISEPRPDTQGPPEEERRSWWRRFFGL